MKTWTFTLPELLLSLGIQLCHLNSSASTFGEGELEMLDMGQFSTSRIRVYGGVVSEPISTGRPFPFGPTNISTVTIHSDGFISMGDSTTTSPSIPGALNIIYPYYKDLSAYSEAYSSTITYTNGITSLSSQMSSVNGFIQTHMDNTFSGTGMMVVDWFLVSGDAFRPAVLADFQAVLITDNSASFAVFIYKCGRFGYSGAFIGWAFSDTVYEVHPLSGGNSDRIACKYSPHFSAIAYRLDFGKSQHYDAPQTNCFSGEFICDSGLCIEEIQRCDGNNDCRDNSDEENCDHRTCYFLCLNGECEPRQYRCNGFDECGDNSDEENCTFIDNNCVLYTMPCDNGVCWEERCDDNGDKCGDNNDEENCNTEENVELAVGLSYLSATVVVAGISGIVVALYCRVKRRRRQGSTNLNKNSNSSAENTLPCPPTHPTQEFHNGPQHQFQSRYPLTTHSTLPSFSSHTPAQPQNFIRTSIMDSAVIPFNI